MTSANSSFVGRGIYAEQFRRGPNLVELIEHDQLANEKKAKIDDLRSEKTFGRKAIVKRVKRGRLGNVELKMVRNKTITRDFSVLIHALGVDENDLLDYLNWCLLEHLVATFSEEKIWIQSLRSIPSGLAQFKAVVEKRTRLRWDVENVSKLYDRVIKATQKHYRKPISYEELIRLLINSPLKCSNSFCGKAPPAVKLHIDHSLPASKGGGSKFENLKFLCEKCNLSKSNKLERSGIWLTLESLQPF